MQTLTKIWTLIRHNPGIVFGIVLAIAVIVWTYGCHSKVVSITNSPMLVTRAELDLEVNHFLEMAEIRYTELDQQDEFKRTFFAMAIDFMQGGEINPVAVALVIGNLLGVGFGIDNLKKRTHINTLKGGNGKAKEKSSESSVS